jgi:hypothetical protein
MQSPFVQSRKVDMNKNKFIFIEIYLRVSSVYYLAKIQDPHALINQ